MDFSEARGQKSSEVDNKNALKAIRIAPGIPICFFGQNHLRQLASELTGKIPDDITKLMSEQRLDYGWMRNKAYLMALTIGAKAVQFFDIDTRPIVNSYPDMQKYPNILKIHWNILLDTKVAAASGNYFGPRAVTTSMFGKAEVRAGFLRLLKRTTTFDVLDPPVVGGAMAVNLAFAELAPFPLLRETAMSDDLLITYLASLLGWETQQSGELIEHNHGGPLDPEDNRRIIKDFVPGYFARIMRITALMTMLGKEDIRSELRGIILHPKRKVAVNVTNKENTEACEERVRELLNEISRLVAKDTNGDLLLPIVKSLEERVKDVSGEMAQGVQDYLEFVACWPTIVTLAKTHGKDWVTNI